MPGLGLGPPCRRGSRSGTGRAALADGEEGPDPQTLTLSTEGLIF